MLDFFITLKAKLIVGAIVGILIFGAGFKTCAVIRDAQHAKELQAEIDAKMAWIKYGDDLSTKLEAELAKQRAANRKLNRRVQDEITQHDLFKSLLPDTSVSLFNEGVSGEATSEPGAGMRTTPTTSSTGNGGRFVFPSNNHDQPIQ